jgi:hypothetical protein
MHFVVTRPWGACVASFVTCSSRGFRRGSERLVATHSDRQIPQTRPAGGQQQPPPTSHRSPRINKPSPAQPSVMASHHGKSMPHSRHLRPSPQRLLHVLWDCVDRYRMLTPRGCMSSPLILLRLDLVSAHKRLLLRRRQVELADHDDPVLVRVRGRRIAARPAKQSGRWWVHYWSNRQLNCHFPCDSCASARIAL